MDEQKLRQTVREVSKQLTDIERQLYDAGLAATATTVNQAVQRLGWEAAEKLCAQCNERR